MVEHVTISDADRHEAKHVSTAAPGQVLKCVSPGISGFSFMSYNELTNKPTVTGLQSLLVGQSGAVNQLPSALGTALQVEFGALQNTTHASLSSVGNLTFNTAGQYVITIFLRMGRTTAVGDVYLYSRFLINGVQYLGSNGVRLPSQEIVVPYSATVSVNVNAGDVFSVQLLRDVAGINNGGLYQLTPSAAGWASSPTATIAVSKFIGLS